MAAGREHWDDVYARKDRTEVSWYSAHLERSLAWIDGLGLGPSAHVADVGGGASTLVDDLLARGHERVTILDVSSVALERTRARLTAAERERVTWVVGDATGPLLGEDDVDVWHDRAVFHFLNEPSQRAAYVAQVRRCVRVGGHVILATFAPDGPLRCSGLPVSRYGPEELSGALGGGFERVAQAREVHTTPWDAEQAFTWVSCRRVG